MRKKLSAIDGTRQQFIAVFTKTGKKVNYKGYSEETILLTNIRDAATGRLLADHVWFTYSKTFQDVRMTQGDEIIFDARVKQYQKGYVNRQAGFSSRKKDFKLSYPSNVRIYKGDAAS